MKKDINFSKSHNWLVGKILTKKIKKIIEKYACGKLIDIGCGERPFKKYLESKGIEYTGLDHRESVYDIENVDLVGTAYKIPAQDSEFDVVFSTAVLEHLEEPRKALDEANRVLKEGGHTIFSIPLFWHLHDEPRDFYRFTKYGIRYLFEKSGFEVKELIPLSGFWVTFGQELVYYLWRFKTRWKKNPLKWLIPPAGHVIQSVCYLLSKLDHSYEFTWMYLVVARKIKVIKTV